MEPYFLRSGVNFEPLPTVLVILTLVVLLIVLAVTIVLTAVIWCKLFSKAGYHWTRGLLMLVPIANIIMPFILAFGEWPIQKELQHLRQRLDKPSTD